MIQNPGFIAEIISRNIITAGDYARLSSKHKGDDFSILQGQVHRRRLAGHPHPRFAQPAFAELPGEESFDQVF